MAIYREGINLSKLTDKQLKAIERSMSVSTEEVSYYSAEWQGSPSRMTVIRAAVAIDIANRVWGTTTYMEPSAETLSWGDHSGGTRFHQAPERMAEIIASAIGAQ